jgi:hypothetical protein
MRRRLNIDAQPSRSGRAPLGSSARGAGRLPLTLEGRLAEVDCHRVRVQRLAREQLTSEGAVLTRLGVARRACALLDQPAGSRVS